MAEKTIYALVDTLDVEEQVDLFIEDIESGWYENDYELTKEQMNELKKQLLEDSTSGGLAHVVSECWDTWVGEEFRSLVNSAITDWIGDRVKDILNEN